MRRLLALPVAAALAAGALAGASPAAAADDFSFDNVRNWTLQPGEGWAEIGPLSWYGGEPTGWMVYALSKKPLTDPSWTDGGLPSGLQVNPGDECRAADAAVGIYICKGEYTIATPTVTASPTAAHGTTAHFGVAYAPDSGSIDKAVKEAQTAATFSENGRHAARTITVKSAEHVAQNTMSLRTPTLKAGGSVTQSVTVHAVDEGELQLSFRPADGMRWWEEHEATIEIDSVSRAGNAECRHSTGSVAWGGITCQVTPGDATISWTLKADAATAAWQLSADAVYEVYTFGTGNPTASADFAVDSPHPVRTHHNLLAKSKDGVLQYMEGTGLAARPFKDWVEHVGGGWNTYNALTKLSPVTSESLGGGIVGRDSAGVLWHYTMSGTWTVISPRTKVGGGWQIFDKLTGAGDLNGDGKADLLARDKAGVLWLYKGTGNAAAPFAARTQVGGGWQTFGELTGAGDVSGDGKADLLARDKAGVLWLYKGTGNAAAPFAARTQIGGGWQVHRSLTSPGDMTDDGRADLIAQDTAGRLWLYRGTGKASAPYATRTEIDHYEDDTVSAFATLL
ncbi:FG-GAP repeat domain-containing protein [Streptomyces genisteinicus]|uniref:VCBS repeat-containing protein n=1 Tax=Streptomyces genisteinicus TaxID=2768068 RepID=A0A7H0HVV7_9ACTN|nr:VCBS repeat-containing protein [Streptomyces genisteinicus]QNP64673.1 VCBS repeat-containing protein [Streptomyces genisteinicus]